MLIHPEAIILSLHEDPAEICENCKRGPDVTKLFDVILLEPDISSVLCRSCLKKDLDVLIHRLDNGKPLRKFEETASPDGDTAATGIGEGGCP